MIEDDKKDNKPANGLPAEPKRYVGDDSEIMSFSWSAVSKVEDAITARQRNGADNFLSDRMDFVGKNLEGGKFEKENLEGASFSVSNLEGVNFSGSNLKGADFSGANLKDANLSGANLEGAIFAGAQLISTNFTGANLRGVKLTEADIQDAILVDIEIDEIGLEELQHLIEYIAKYYPHKLNLTRINLTLLDLTKIDLSKVNLKGVDFTGCDFTGVNIMELDLSECIITPEQIAQALGRVPNKEELAKIMAPKKKAPKGKGGVDFTDLFFDNGRKFGMVDAMRHKGTNIQDILDAGKKVYRQVVAKPEPKDEEILEKIKEERQKTAEADKEEARNKIEENKRRELEKRKEQQKEVAQEMTREEKPQQRPERRIDPHALERAQSLRDRSRD